MKLSTIHWAACRRGMLELDVLLERYVNHRFSQANHEEQQQFELLLTCNDQDLHTWLIKRQDIDQAPNPELIDIILTTAANNL